MSQCNVQTDTGVACHSLSRPSGSSAVKRVEGVSGTTARYFGCICKAHLKRTPMSYVDPKLDGSKNQDQIKDDPRGGALQVGCMPPSPP